MTRAPVDPTVARADRSRRRVVGDADVRALPGDARARRGPARLGRRGPRVPRHGRRARGARRSGTRIRGGSRRSSARRATIGLTSNLFATPPQAELAERLAELLPIADARVFFCNSGAEANEAAAQARPDARPSRRASRRSSRWTARSTAGPSAALAATGQPDKRAAFEPLVDWFRFVPPGDAEALARRAATGDVAAVLLEPVLGEGGVIPLDETLPARRSATLRRARGAVRGRRGAVRDRPLRRLARRLAPAGVVPDVVSLAKALGGGLPIGALVARADARVRARRARVDLRRGPVAVRGGARGARHDRATRTCSRHVRATGELLRDEVTRLAPTGTLVDVRGRGFLCGFQVAEGIAAATSCSRCSARAASSRRPPDPTPSGSRRRSSIERGARRRGRESVRRGARGGRAVSRAVGATKAKRQQAILQLVAREQLGSQDEIRARLAELGIEATQSTISRDVEELGLARVHDADGAALRRAGGVRLLRPDGAPAPPARRVRALVRAERERPRRPDLARRGGGAGRGRRPGRPARGRRARSPATTRSWSSGARASTPSAARAVPHRRSWRHPDDRPRHERHTVRRQPARRRCSPTAAGSTPRSRSTGSATRATRCTRSPSTSASRRTSRRS